MMGGAYLRETLIIIFYSKGGLYRGGVYKEVFIRVNTVTVVDQWQFTCEHTRGTPDVDYTEIDCLTYTGYTI